MELPYPEYEGRALWLLDQTMRPRSWCLVLISWPYPFSVAVTLSCREGLKQFHCFRLQSGEKLGTGAEFIYSNFNFMTLTYLT